MFGLFLVLIGFLIAIWAQIRVQTAFSRWMKVPALSGLTGAEVARRILDQSGLYNVPVEWIPGHLTDHYDPTRRAVCLSETVYHSSSIAAISVAAHECGHALQHQEGYGALILRHRMVPVLMVTSGFAPWLLLIGILLHASNLLLLGILFFFIAVLFHLVTLPVEFNASARAKEILLHSRFIRNEEERGVRSVLNAAAFTYVASALVALLQLFRFLLIYLAQQNDER